MFNPNCKCPPGLLSYYDGKSSAFSGVRAVWLSNEPQKKHSITKVTPLSISDGTTGASTLETAGLAAQPTEAPRKHIPSPSFEADRQVSPQSYGSMSRDEKPGMDSLPVPNGATTDLALFRACQQRSNTCDASVYSPPGPPSRAFAGVRSSASGVARRPLSCSWGPRQEVVNPVANRGKGDFRSQNHPMLGSNVRRNSQASGLPPGSLHAHRPIQGRPVSNAPLIIGQASFDTCDIVPTSVPGQSSAGPDRAVTDGASRAVSRVRRVAVGNDAQHNRQNIFGYLGCC